MITLCNICKEVVYPPTEIFTDSAISVHVKVSLCSFKCFGMYKRVFSYKYCVLKEMVKEIKKIEVLDEKPIP